MNMPLPQVGRRISDADIDHLHDLLERRAVPHEGMSLEMLDGFLSALVVGPDTVLPSEYWPLIWNHEVVWDDEAEVGEAHRLVTALWNDILFRVTMELPDDDDESDEAGDILEQAMPLLAMPDLSGIEDEDEALAAVPEDYPAAAAWAIGFLQGVGLRSEDWSRWEDDDEHVASDLATIAELTVLGPEQAEELGLGQDEVPDFTERMAIAGSLPVILQNFNLYRLEQLRPQTVRREEGPGRNDPCPCGSGLKFKKCCGDPARLN